MKKMKMMKTIGIGAAAVAVVVLSSGVSYAQAYPPRTVATPSKPAPVLPPSVAPADFIIGPEDVLHIVVWGEPMTGDFIVRSDGKISVPPLEEMVASGLKPEELAKKIKTALPKFYEEPVPDVFVVVKAMNSKKVFVQGAVNKQGPVMLTGPIRFSQLVSLFGGFQEFANRKKILVISGTQKNAKGEPMTWFINYEEISQGKNLGKNDLMLQPGDTVIVSG